jgi:hypothetical protein
MMDGLIDACARLARPGVRWRLVVLVLLLTLPALWNGLALDDLWHRRVLVEGVGFSGERAHPLDLFSFFPNEPALYARLLEEGIWPWWGSHSVHVEFFRPLSALTHALDYAIWPERPALMHLHSMIWYAALVVAVAALLWRMLPPRAAALAAVLYAVCDANAMAASWLASRNALLATLLAVLAIHAHDRARRDGWRPGSWLGPAAFACGLLAGELAVGALGYLVAHAWRVDRSERRWWALAPYAAVALGWQIGYRAAGYGASGLGIYSDPVGDPLGFVAKLAVRLPVLLFSRLWLPLADGWAFMPRTQALVTAAVAALGAAALVALAWRHLRSDRVAGFWAIGALLAVVPGTVVVPTDRVWMLAGVGVAAALGSWVVAVAERGQSKLARGAALVLLLRHTVLAVLLLPMRSTLPRVFGAAMSRAADSAPDDAALAHETLVVVNAPHVFFSSMVPLLRREEGGTVPARLRTLVATMDAVELTRVDEHSVALRVAGGFLDRPADELAWSRDEPRPAGYRIQLSDMSFEVTRATSDGRPEEVLVRFGASPRRLRWVTWKGDGFAPFELPRVGERVELEAIQGFGPARHSSSL